MSLHKDKEEKKEEKKESKRSDLPRAANSHPVRASISPVAFTHQLSGRRQDEMDEMRELERDLERPLKSLSASQIHKLVKEKEEKRSVELRGERISPTDTEAQKNFRELAHFEAILGVRVGEMRHKLDNLRSLQASHPERADEYAQLVKKYATEAAKRLEKILNIFKSALDLSKKDLGKDHIVLLSKYKHLSAQLKHFQKLAAAPKIESRVRHHR